MLDFTRVGARHTLRSWVASKRSALQQIPRPTGSRSVHSDGVDADRVLIFGSGLAVGWGATSHTDALPGHIAGALSDLTGRGTDVDIIADPWLRIDGARSALADRRLWRFDLIVLTLGSNDALDLVSPRHWTTELSKLLDLIAAQAAPATRVVIVGIEPVGALAVFDGPNAERADAAAASLNAASAALAASRAGVTFVTLQTASSDYAAAADQLADSVLDELNSSRAESVGAPRGAWGQADDDRERERQEGVDLSGIVDTPEEDRFDRIVTMARQLYGTSGAAFAVVDRDRVWHKSKSEGVPVEVGRDQSFCSATILLRGAHVVPDMWVEAAPGDTSAADAVGVRFYAGYPVESPNGEQIGALCIFDEKPRVGDDFDASMLRQLALLIQAEIEVEALAG